MPEFLHDFKNWLRGLTSGEAEFYGYLLQVSIAVLIFVGGWFNHKRWKRQKTQNPPPTNSIKEDQVKKGVGNIEGGTNTFNFYDGNGADKTEETEVETKPETPKLKIISNRVPEVKGEFFEREAELQVLNGVWAGNDTRIIQFIAPGSTGKTKLLHHWPNHTDNIDTLIAWSFYSQGPGENKKH